MMRLLKRLASVFRSDQEQVAEERPSWRPGSPKPLAEPKRFSTIKPGATPDSDAAELSEEKPKEEAK